MRTDLVSVIIPCYKQAHFLPLAISSCLQQTYPEIEIIIVNDGSPDDVSAALRPFENRVRQIVQKNLGLSAARNTGIAHSRGEFIQFLDADDLLSKKTIELQITFLKKHPDISISVCRNKLFDTTRPSGQPNPIGEWRLYRQALDTHLCYLNIAPPHAFFIRKGVIKATGRFDTELKACEDYDYWIRAASLGFVPHHNPMGNVYYRKHGQSMSANLENQIKHDILLHHRLAQILEEHPQFPNRHRREGLMAFSASVLNTVRRLNELDLEGATSLMRLADIKLRQVSKLSDPRGRFWNALSVLFYLRLESIIADLSFINCGEQLELYYKIKKSIDTIGGRHKKLMIYASLLLALVKNIKKNGIENFESLGYLIKNTLRRLPFYFSG